MSPATVRTAPVGLRIRGAFVVMEKNYTNLCPPQALPSRPGWARNVLFRFDCVFLCRTMREDPSARLLLAVARGNIDLGLGQLEYQLVNLWEMSKVFRRRASGEMSCDGSDCCSGRRGGVTVTVELTGSRRGRSEVGNNYSAFGCDFSDCVSSGWTRLALRFSRCIAS